MEDVVGFVQPDPLVRFGDGEPESLPAGLVVLMPESVGVFDVYPQRGWSCFTKLP